MRIELSARARDFGQSDAHYLLKELEASCFTITGPQPLWTEIWQRPIAVGVDPLPFLRRLQTAYTRLNMAPDTLCQFPHDMLVYAMTNALPDVTFIGLKHALWARQTSYLAFV